jgi:hypothetical protein
MNLEGAFQIDGKVDMDKLRIKSRTDVRIGAQRTDEIVNDHVLLVQKIALDRRW